MGHIPVRNRIVGYAVGEARLPKSISFLSEQNSKKEVKIM
jgi:hypothetical protein